MESHPNFYDDGHFSDQNPSPKGSVYNGSYSGGAFEDWNFEEFRCEPGLDVNHFQPVLGFESENGIAQSNSSTDFRSSQSSSHTTFGTVGNNHSNSIWIPQEAPEAYSWLPTFNETAACTDFRQEINYGVRITKSPTATAFIPSHNVGPPQINSPSSPAVQPPCNEQVKLPGYPPQQGFELLPNEERGENHLFNNSTIETSSQQTNRTTPSRFRSLTKPKPRASKFYCSIRPCNHQKAFARKADLERHLTTQHTPLYSLEKKFSQCPWPDCERKGTNGFPRRDKMLQHQDRVHGRRL